MYFLLRIYEMIVFNLSMTLNFFWITVAYFVLKMIHFMRCINLPICMVNKCVLFKD